MSLTDGLSTVMYLFADAPVITQGPGNIDAIQSQEYVLRCKARGVPDPKYEFFKVSGHQGFIFR